MKVLGHQILIEMYGCDARILTDSAMLESTVTRAATEAGATVVNTVFHNFAPSGISGAVIIAESHITVHTWPEFSYAAVDVFTCGETIDARAVMALLVKFFAARDYAARSFDRGIPSE
jgi:S-adenosylmethionine decarboxylase proenzyme